MHPTAPVARCWVEPACWVRVLAVVVASAVSGSCWPLLILLLRRRSRLAARGEDQILWPVTVRACRHQDEHRKALGDTGLAQLQSYAAEVDR